MQTITQESNTANLLHTKRNSLRRLLLNYINFLVRCLNKAETKNEAKRILDSLKFLENRMWIQNHSDKELSYISYLKEERKIYKAIENLYLPF
ncbi:MAG: hypothetical protein ACFFB6_04910 [Promethearchaeota archaeon]